MSGPGIGATQHTPHAQHTPHRPFDDRLTITTPEGVELEIALAGLGSRFTARLLDNLIRAVLVFVFLVTVGLIYSDEGASGGVALAVMSIVFFVMLFLYDVVFELANKGRTPGKAAVGIRVVRVGGQPVTFWPSVLRNLIRLIDETATLGLIGAVTVLATKREQRLGDLAAGTLVVRDRLGDTPRSAALPGWVNDPDAPFLTWDVSAISQAEITTVRQFLERRPQLRADARQDLARQLAERIRPRIPGAPNWSDEQFLVAVAAAKARRADST